MGFKITYTRLENTTTRSAFYELVLLETPGRDHILFKRWGKIGSSGQIQPLAGNRAPSEYAKVFNDKTGNHYHEKANETYNFVTLELVLKYLMEKGLPGDIVRGVSTFAGGEPVPTTPSTTGVAVLKPKKPAPPAPPNDNYGSW